MASNKTTAERIELQRIKMEQEQNEMKRLLRQQKEEIRKERTHRICERGALLEGMLPGTITLSKERFRLFLERTVSNKFGRDHLALLIAEQEKADAKSEAGVIADGGEIPAEMQGGADQQSDTTPTVKPTDAGQNVGEPATVKAGATPQKPVATGNTKPTQPPQGGGGAASAAKTGLAEKGA